MRREVTQVGEGADAFPSGRAWAALGVVAIAVVLLGLPVLVVSGLVPGGAAFAWVAASLAAVTGGGKLAAVAWGLGARFLAAPRLRTAEARID